MRVDPVCDTQTEFSRKGVTTVTGHCPPVPVMLTCRIPDWTVRIDGDVGTDRVRHLGGNLNGNLTSSPSFSDSG